ncbi:uncharacterized protein LOC131801646 [Musca domestica]|uniref:Uncharacterized protein LOC101891694 n=1 Tax=Musca domestica TaxID=7370 RepID=A0A1I8MQW4_MUSDO|nr:uncharacterized protein LOC101891694 [Musca domestica]XP_058976511.1 uncharacterized protein LOC131801646 [Musca domestica]
MACSSHRNLSLLVGWLNVILPVLSTIAILVSWLIYDTPETKGDSQRYAALLLALIFTYLILWFILSVLLTKGIYEKRHKLMIPWVYLTGFIIFALTFLLVYDIIADVILGYSFIILLLKFIGNCLTLGTIVFVSYPVFMYYMKIRYNWDDPELK